MTEPLMPSQVMAIYTRPWVNRRCRRAMHRPPDGAYTIPGPGELLTFPRHFRGDWLYRQSWDRARRRWPFPQDEPSVTISITPEPLP
jgi:hypothetical protein